MSEPKIRIQVNVYEHGTVVGSDDEDGVMLEFDDFVRAVQGLVGWAAGLLTETNDESEKEIGSAMLVAALHEWTFSEHEEEDTASDDEDLEEDDESPPLPPNS
jgi:hypothetical protein